MCLYPKRIHNKKYQANDKNGGNPPSLPITGTDQDGYAIYDDRVTIVEVPCGNCIECREAKAREWQVRLNEEIKDHKYNYYITLTFSPDGLREILFKHNIKESNAAAAFALRHCLERWRRDHGKSIKHWFVTELGDKNTERIHMHGFFLADEKLEFKEIRRIGDGIMAEWKYWKYGHIFVGDYVSARSINYMVKYIEKIDNNHKGFVGRVFASPGIGRGFTDRLRECSDTSYKYRPRHTKDYYTLNTGARVKIPKYYANKERSEDERELIWREFMDREVDTIGGVTFDKKTPVKVLVNVEEKAREMSKRAGYGDDSQEWKKIDYNITRRQLINIERKQQQIKMLTKLIESCKDHDQRSNYRRQLISIENSLNELQKKLNT